MKTRTFLIAALYLLAACAKDEGADGSNQPGNETGDETPQETSISFTADIPAFVKGESRTTVDNNWSELLNPAVAVEIDGVVKAYTVDVKGSLTSEDPFLWGDKKEVTVNAWYPYAEGSKISDEALTVMADQSKLENFVGSDQLEVVSATVTPSYSVLSFSHRMAKLVCSLTVEDGTAEGAVVRLLNLKQVQEGTSVITTSDWKALMVPQTVPAGQDFVEVTVPSLGNLSFVSAPDADFVFEKGKVYYLNINVSEEGITNVNISSSVAWGNSETVPVPGTTTEVSPSPVQPGWGAGSEDTSMSGESSEVTPSPEAPGWGNGNNTDIPGTSTSVTSSPVTPPSWGDGGSEILEGKEQDTSSGQ